MKKKLAMLAALAMAMTMFAACGSDDSSSTTSTANDSSSAVEESSEPEEESSEEESSEEESSEEESSEDESSEGEEPGEEVEFDGTIYTDGEYTDDFSAPNFVIDSDGNTQYFIGIDCFEPYAETGCTVTIDYLIEQQMNFKTLEEDFYPYYLIAPFNGASWEKLYPDGVAAGTPFITGMPDEMDARGEIGNGIPVKDDFTGDYFMQSDGTIVLCQDADGNWPEVPIVFDLTAEGVQYLIDNQGEAEDGTLWGGLSFQIYGVNVQSVTLSEIAE